MFTEQGAYRLDYLDPEAQAPEQRTLHTVSGFVAGRAWNDLCRFVGGRWPDALLGEQAPEVHQFFQALLAAAPQPAGEADLPAEITAAITAYGDARADKWQSGPTMIECTRLIGARLQADAARIAALQAERDEARTEVERLRALLRGLLASETGRQTLHKLDDGQGTDTDDGRLWLAARDQSKPGAPA